MKPLLARLSPREKLAFGIGELGGSGLWQISMIFLPVFYTDVLGIPAAAVGTLLLIVRVIDAISDPVMGIIADRTTSRWGKFRPYLLWGAVPFGLAVFLLFAIPKGPHALTYAYMSYIGMMLVYTAVMIPFSALSGVLTSDGGERTTLNSYRFLCAFGAAMLVQGAVQGSVARLGGGNTELGYKLTMAIFGGLSVIGFWIAFAGTRERVQPVDGEHRASSVARDLKDLSRNTPWIIVLSVTLVSLVYISIRSAAQVYYFKYAVGNEGLLSGYMLAGTASVLAGIAVTAPLTRIFGKKWLYIGCLALSGVTALAVTWIDPKAVTVLFVLQILSSFASGPAMPLLWSMMADAADYSEWKTGRRATGLVFAASTFATKFGGAIGGVVAMFVLERSGYRPNLEQSAEVVRGLQSMMGVYPAVGAALSIVILWFYRLDTATLATIAGDLTVRRNATAAAAA